MAEIAKLGFNFSHACLANLYANVNNIYKNVKFVPYKTGPRCNATRSVLFSMADCDLVPITVADIYDIGQTTLTPYMLCFNFDKLYKKGFDVIGNLFSGSVNSDDLGEPYKRAFHKLFTFIQDIGSHQKCLVKVLKETQNKERDVAIVVAEHLLGKLCPGESYFVNHNSKEKGGCMCGCGAEIEFAGTGIGNENVWHGFLDIVFQSNEGLVYGLVIVPPSTEEPEARRVKDSDDEDTDETGVEVKRIHSESLANNQIAAQTIVFSLLQKNSHPALDNFLIPTIAVSATHVRIYMYDAENDIFVHCQEMPILEKSTNLIELQTVLTLWMVLNYRLFCSGINAEDYSKGIELAKSGFEQHISSCPEYRALESCVCSFQNVHKNIIVTNDDVYRAIPLLKPDFSQHSLPPMQF